MRVLIVLLFVLMLFGCASMHTSPAQFYKAGVTQEELMKDWQDCTVYGGQGAGDNTFLMWAQRDQCMKLRGYQTQ